MALWRHKIFRKCLGSLFWRVEKVSAPGEQPHWYAVCQTSLYCLQLPIVARPAKFSLALSAVSKLLPGKGSFSLLLCMHTLCDNMQAVGGGQRLLLCGWECTPSNQGNHGNHICSTDDAHNLLKVVWLTTSGAHTKRESDRLIVTWWAVTGPLSWHKLQSHYQVLNRAHIPKFTWRLCTERQRVQ